MNDVTVRPIRADEGRERRDQRLRALQDDAADIAFTASYYWVRERGLDHARLHVHADNERARRAYEKIGFTATGATLTGLIGPELELARRF